MAALPVEVLLGLYLGLLTGIIPALVAWSLGFSFKYVTGVSVPALAVVVLGVAIAGANGGLLALVDPSVTTHPNAERVVVAIVVVMMMALYAHSQGDRLAATFPHRLSFRSLRDRTLAADVVELVGGRGEVLVTVAGEVDDIEGYPPLPDEVSTELRRGEWRFPADLPLPELERRLSDRLRSTYDLAEVAVAIDERGRARVAAAPGTHGVSARVPLGRRAVSVDGLVPTGLGRGDEVTLLLADGAVDGTVVSARSSPALPDPRPEGADVEELGEPTDDSQSAPTPRTATTTGGEGRITVAVPRREAERVLRADPAGVVVTSRGVRSEFELLGVLHRAGTRLRRLVVREDSELAGRTLSEAAVRDDFGVEVLALRVDGRWQVAPPGSARLEPGAELFVVGQTDDVGRLAGVVG